MNRRGKNPNLYPNFNAGQIQMLDIDYSWETLTANQRKKCKQKFDTYKPPNSDKISKFQLQRMLRQMGKDLNEEEILQKIWEADPRGQGFISFQSFIKTIQNQKQKKFNQVTNFIGLTFDSVLKQQKNKMEKQSLQQITWDFLKSYMSQNFEIQININSLAGKKSVRKSLNRNQFMSIFS